jgi:hypothetical protein
MEYLTTETACDNLGKSMASNENPTSTFLSLCIIPYNTLQSTQLNLLQPVVYLLVTARRKGKEHPKNSMLMKMMGSSHHLCHTQPLAAARQSCPVAIANHPRSLAASAQHLAPPARQHGIFGCNHGV